jgi:hypothetical protein
MRSFWAMQILLGGNIDLSNGQSVLYILKCMTWLNSFPFWNVWPYCIPLHFKRCDDIALPSILDTWPYCIPLRFAHLKSKGRILCCWSINSKKTGSRNTDQPAREQCHNEEDEDYCTIWFNSRALWPVTSSNELSYSSIAPGDRDTKKIRALHLDIQTSIISSAQAQLPWFWDKINEMAHP